MWMSRKKYQEIMLKEQYVKTQLERLLKLSEEVKLLRGDRMPSEKCKYCKNGIVDYVYKPNKTESYKCLLDCNCKEFILKDTTNSESE